MPWLAALGPCGGLATVAVSALERSCGRVVAGVGICERVCDIGMPTAGTMFEYPLVRVKGPPIMVERGTPGIRGGRGGNAMVPGAAGAAGEKAQKYSGVESQQKMALTDRKSVV